VLTTEAAEDIIRTYFATWVQDLRLQVRSVDAGAVTVCMPFSESLYRSGGIVSGQALMALADTTMVIALCASKGGFLPVTTVDMNTTFMRPAANANVLAEATILRQGRTMAFCQARLLMDTPERQLVANATGTYAILQG
jgi:uncharacterized protein (TIGR00369 family)